MRSLIQKRADLTHRQVVLASGRLNYDYLVFASGQRIDSANIIWAVGMSANPVTRKLGVELDRSGRVRVNPDLSLPGHAEVFAIGDLAEVTDENGNLIPVVSAAAMQMVQHVALMLKAELNVDGSGLDPRPAFRYWNRGTMATVGRSMAIAQIGRYEFSGWLAWLLVHLIFLIEFRNKAAVLLQWIHSYFTYKLGLPRHFQWNCRFDTQASRQCRLTQSPVFRASGLKTSPLKHLHGGFDSTENVEEPKLGSRIVTGLDNSATGSLARQNALLLESEEN